MERSATFNGFPFIWAARWIINLDVGQTHVDGEVYISRDELLAKIPSARTMPQIFKQSNTAAIHIGGFAELKKHLHVKESYVPA